MAARQLITKGLCFKIGDGYGIWPWSCLWVPRLLNATPRLQTGANWGSVRRVANLRDFGKDE